MLNLFILFFVCSAGIEVASQNVTTTLPTTTTSALAPPTCGSFPRVLNKEGDCCFVPNHFDSDLLKSCTAAAAKKYKSKRNATILREVQDCYTSATKLIANAVFKKDVAREIYVNNTEQHEQHLGFNPWIKIVDEVLKLCEYSNANLTAFYICMTTNMIDKCPWSAIVSSDVCDEVDKFYESCLDNDASYCKEWPTRLVLPESCCDSPEIISKTMIAECTEECSSKVTHTEKAACKYECCYRKANVKNGGKFDFEAVKKVLLAYSNKASEWETSINKAVEACKPQVEAVESSQTDVQANNFLKRCIHENLGNNCVEFKSDLSCQRVKRYMKKCPGVFPKRAEIATKKPAATIPATAPTEEHTTVTEEVTTTADGQDSTADQESTTAGEEALTTIETATETGS